MYWRRRLVVGLGLLAVIVIILLIVFAPKGGKATTASTSSPKPSTTSSAPAAAAGDAPACAASDITITAKVDQASYSPETQPQLSFSITNDGAAACTMTDGSDVQVFEITSGNEVYWKSTDCQTGKKANTNVIEAGKSLDSAAIGWDRTRSSTKTCNSTRAAVPANGASYHLTVTVDKMKSANSPQFVLQ